jgi:hypothetical protein
LVHLDIRLPSRAHVRSYLLDDHREVAVLMRWFIFLMVFSLGYLLGAVSVWTFFARRGGVPSAT